MCGRIKAAISVARVTGSVCVWACCRRMLLVVLDFLSYPEKSENMMESELKKSIVLEISESEGMARVTKQSVWSRGRGGVVVGASTALWQQRGGGGTSASESPVSS